MPDERKPDLNALTRNKLPVASRKADVPAKRDEGVEHREPSIRQVQTEQGRTPAEVMEAREQEQAQKAVQQTQEHHKEEKPARKVKVKGQEITLEQLANQPDLLEALITTAEQFPALQQKHQKLLEEISQKALERKEPEQKKEEAPTEVITQAQIRQKYDPLVKQSVDAGYMESDFAEAYPDIAAQLIYHRDIIYALDQVAAYCREWIRCEVELRNAQEVESRLNGAVDAVAAKGDGDGKDARIFKPLRDKDQREEFIQWVRTDLDPKVGALTPVNMERYWKTYVADKLLEVVATEEHKEPARKDPKKAGGDGVGGRSGVPETPPQLTPDRKRFVDMLNASGKVSLEE
jgi:hypothetical protein